MVYFETIISILPNGNKAFIPTPTNVRPSKVFTGTSQESTIRGCKLLRLTIASYDTFDVSSMQFSRLCKFTSFDKYEEDTAVNCTIAWWCAIVPAASGPCLHKLYACPYIGIRALWKRVGCGIAVITACTQVMILRCAISSTKFPVWPLMRQDESGRLAAPFPWAILSDHRLCNVFWCCVKRLSH